MPVLPAPPPPPVAPIEIVVTDVRGDRGHLRLEVCREAEFLHNCALAASVPARAGAVKLALPDVPAGRYAIQAVHDENDNGKVDRNFIGIPKEGIGFSRDVRVCTGPPRFADAAFDHGAAPQRLTFRIRYHLC